METAQKLEQQEFDFKNPDYNFVSKNRADRLFYLKKNPKEIPAIRKYYQDHIDDFINDWGCTVDPRNADRNLPVLIPFVLFPRQREFIKWLYSRWKNRQDGICVKSRDMGVSWLTCAFAASLSILHDRVVVGIGSRKEIYIDDNTPKSAFWRIREFLRYLPDFFAPSSVRSAHMRLENHDNGSWIVGEAGANIGRGDRTSLYFVDEAAFVERQEQVDAALSQTSNCKIWVSTINEPGDAFHQKQISGQFDVFEFDWHDDPRKDQAWYDAQRKKYAHDPILLAREIDRDYSASSGDSWIPTRLIEAAQRLGPADIRQDPYSVKLILGVDAAHMGGDESVISPRAGRIAYQQTSFRTVDGPRLAHEIIRMCDQSLQTVYAIVIELDGPGVSCYDTLRQHNRYYDRVYGVHTSSQGDGQSYNLRAKMYRRAKEWLANLPCSVPSDLQFKTQLSSVKYSYKGGKLLLESKERMRKAGFKSPDKADAFALTFAVDEDMLGLPQEIDEEPERDVGRSPYTGY